ncbi:MAG: NAD(P)H-hydrate epimerase [Omnitrophica bacterium]|nr:NAD(P)H-hydrate epimerase [Candidatus Omnitrophota bacterium]
MKAVTAKEMQEIDRLAREEYGISPLRLMENAGRASAEEIFKRFKTGKGSIFCGKGNNGGDGFVLARYLRERGIKTNVFLLGKASHIKNRAPLVNLDRLKKLNQRVDEILTQEDEIRFKAKPECDFIVDAIFGIGFAGTLSAPARGVVEFMNAVQKPIFALDVPSGLDATTGETRGLCVRAYKTITFGLPKTGFSNVAAGPYLGKVVVKDIGFPIALLK